ncbi:MAG: nucleoside hydrolase [Acidimicrobiales bacterium]|nr:nucleoside hydrolase [Acidimicrobiales bacterium]
MRSVVIDTDTASDDAVALLLAARLPDVDIRAVTTVAGNVPVDLATRNALVTLELAGAVEVPVYQGRPGPLLRPLETAQHVHGTNGMSGVEFPDPQRTAEPEHAIDALRRIAHTEPGRHVLVTLGPLSNVATAVLAEPDLLTRFREVYCMAGAFDGVGNVHPVGEYNVWADPEAARIVVNAPGRTVFVGWDMSWRYAVMTQDEQDELAGLGSYGRFVVDVNAAVHAFCVEESGLAGFDLPDPITMAVALRPELALERDECHVTVGTDEAGRGGTFVDHRITAPAPNATVVRKVDEAGFKALLRQVCGD